MRDTGRRGRGTVVAVVLPMLLLTSAAVTPATRAASRAGLVMRTPADTGAEAPWRAKVRAFAEAHLQHTAWGPAHGRRDYETTLALAKAEGLTVDDDALYAAAYLHDMGGIPPYDLPGVDHGDRSIQLVDTVLRDAGFPMEKSALVKEIIDHHQYYRPPDTLRVAVLFRDADILDFMGAIDVARIISLTSREKFTPDLAHAVAVIREQMKDMPTLLQSDAAKREGQKRVREMQQYLDALSAESDSLTVL
ncbi:MAG TPA: HD domain-containing protein [Gemmatimonadaceae bacterium]|nr:HD domain-containing protein [Gemmatimonadaceae bacterium]